MLSMPPDTIISLLEALSRSCANMAAFMPDPHILLTVVHPVDSGSPAARAAWRAGACPWPAASTQPMMTSCTCSALTPERSTAARTAAAPSWGAVNSLRSPCIAPIGVRAAEMITNGSVVMIQSPRLRLGAGSETRAKTQRLWVREYVVDVSSGDAPLRGHPEVGVEQLAM